MAYVEEVDNIDMNAVYKVTNMADPTADQDAATKKYVDDQVATADELGELGDVNLDASIDDNEVLAYDDGTSKWINQKASEAGLSEVGHTHALSDLSSAPITDLDDVTITGPVADNEVLAFDGVDTFINQTAAEAGLAVAAHTHTLDDLTDVTGSIDITIDGTPADNEFLAYDTGSGDFVNQTAAEAGVLALAGGTMTGDIHMGTGTVYFGSGDECEIDDLTGSGSLRLIGEEAIVLDLDSTRYLGCDAGAGEVKIWNSKNLRVDGGTLYTDTIGEDDAGQGVTIDSVLLKDGGITVAGNIAMAGNSITGLGTTGQVQGTATEYLGFSTAGYVDLVWADDDKGLRLYSGSNEIGTFSRYDASYPNWLRLDCAASQGLTVSVDGTDILDIGATSMTAHKPLSMSLNLLSVGDIQVASTRYVGITSGGRFVFVNATPDTITVTDATLVTGLVSLNDNMTVANTKDILVATDAGSDLGSATAAFGKLYCDEVHLTTSATEYLSSDGAGILDLHATTQIDLEQNTYVNGAVGIGAAPNAAYPLRVNSYLSGTVTYGAYFTITEDPGATYNYGMGGYFRTTSSHSVNRPGCTGTLFEAWKIGAGNVTNNMGGFAARAIQHGAGTIYSLVGLGATIWIYSAGSGTITTGTALQVGVPWRHASGTATITTQRGLAVANQGAAYITTSHGLLIEDQSGATTSYAIKTGTGIHEFGATLQPDADSTLNLGTTSVAWQASYVDQYHFGTEAGEYMVLATHDIELYAGGDFDIRPTGKTTLGDGGTTNYMAFSATGALTAHGSARWYTTDWLGANALKVPAANQATYQDHGIAGVWQFADGSTKYVHAHIKMPENWASGTDMTLVFGWSSNTADPGDDSKQVVWQAEFLPRQADEDTTAAAEVTDTTTDSASTSSDGLVVSQITLPAANLNASDTCIIIRLARLGGDGDDDLGDTAELHGMCLRYLASTLGPAT